MATAHDVAAYILEAAGPMSAMKLQKLVYYSQAWHLVWEERQLFQERIEAWANGPVVPELYSKHRGRFRVRTWSHGDADALDAGERESVDAVLKFYGDKDAQWLSDLTHAEKPWRTARGKLAPDARGNKAITVASLAEYYGGL